MKNFIFKVDKPENLKRLLNSTESMFVTLLVTDNNVYFMVDDSEVYVQISYEFLSRHNIDKVFAFRLERKKFANLVIGGLQEFIIKDKEVVIVFKNLEGKLAYTLTVDFQADLLLTYGHKLEMLENLEDYPVTSVTQLGLLTRISRSLGTEICCLDNIASVKLSNVFVFKDFKGTDFTILGKHLYLLTSYTTTLYNAQNYLVGKVDNIVIMVNKYKDNYINELDFIRKQPSAFKIEFSLNLMIELCKRLKFSDGTFILDLDNGEAQFIEEHCKYTTPLDIIKAVSAKKKIEEKIDKEEEINEDSLDLMDLFNKTTETVADLKDIESMNKLNIPKLKIPSQVLRSVLANIGVDLTLVLYIKRNFIQINVADLCIVFSRSDYSE